MGLAHSPSLVMNGLVLCLDAGNTKSYPGSGTTWTDLSGNGNTGTLENGVGYNSGNLGSLVFDGVNDRITIPYTQNLAFTNSIFSCEAWVYVSGSFNFPILNKRGNNSTQNSNRPYIFEVTSNAGVTLNLDSASTNCITATGIIQKGQWYHLAATHDRTNAKIYVNGIQSISVASGTNTLNNTGDIPVRIGWRYQNSGIAYAGGRMGKVCIYSRDLTAAEIQQNFNATRSRYSI